MTSHPNPVRSTKVPEIRKGDTVVVLAGKDAGKRGTVEQVIRREASPSSSRSVFRRGSSAGGVSVVVEGLNIAKRHTKPRPKSGRTERQPRIQQGGILDVPQPILASKVMVICPHCSQPTRIKHGLSGEGRSIRVCANCGEPVSREEKK